LTTFFYKRRLRSVAGPPSQW